MKAWKKALSCVLALVMVVCLLPMAAFAEGETPEVVLPDGITEANFPEGTTVTDGTYYYVTLVVALKNIHGSADKRTLWCKPGADVGTMTHGHVCADLTIYGNGAYISGGERDFELDTYKSPSGYSLSCDGLSAETTLTVYRLNGAAAWGQRSTAHAVNIIFEDCKNMQRVYITTTTKPYVDGDTNITLRRCTFDGDTATTYQKAGSCAVYCNYDGDILVEDCTFTGVSEPININHDLDETQTVTVKNSTFTDCGTGKSNDATWAAPIRVKSSSQSEVSLSVDQCTFTYSEGVESCNGDILIGDGRSNKDSFPVSASITNTDAEVQIQHPGDRPDADTNNTAAENKITVQAGTGAEVSNVVAMIGEQAYASLQAAMDAAKTMSGDVTIQVLGKADISSMLNANGTINAIDMSGSALTSLHIQGVGDNAAIKSGIDGHGIDGPTYCPTLSFKLPAGAVLSVENLTFPNDLLFDAPGETVVVQNCVFHGGQSGYPYAAKISYLNNTFDFKGTADNFYSHNAYPVWYKVVSDRQLEFVFTGNTVIGYRGVHIEQRQGTNNATKANITVDNNRFELQDDDHENKTIALQLVNTLNDAVSFKDNYVDAYMGVCFFNGLTLKEDAALTIQNNYLTDGAKLYGSSEWNASGNTDAEKTAAADTFAATIINSITEADGDNGIIEEGHTTHNYVGGVCTICGKQESSTPNPGFPALIPGILGAGHTMVDTYFVDVRPMDYYFDAVNWAYEHGVTGGTGKLTFSPDAPCTRAQAVTFLWRAMGSPASKSSANPFTDVAAGSYYYDAVLWAVENGITNGTSAATFNPNATCTRAQIVTLLYRAIGVKSMSDAGFTDVPASAYYADAVNWACANEITDGTGANRFSPDATCTRAQIVTFLYRSK